MPWKQLKETTMAPEKRTLLQVRIPSLEELGITPENENDLPAVSRIMAEFVDDLMGRNAEKRYQYIQENAKLIDDIDI